MCDTFVALPQLTGRHTILAKNSDREPDEAQAIEYIPGQSHNNSHLKCTFITIDQVPETYGCILSRPFHMWGAEMGVNERGVAIGNEAVFTNVKIAKKNDGLTGMDLLRLALERTKTADAARDLIIQLLEKYGQDACGGYKNRNFFYHNSFLIADPQSAYVLETVDRQWAWKKITASHSISNRLGIGTNYDAISEGAKDLAKSKKKWDGQSPLHFEKVFSDWLMTTFAMGKKRRTTTRNGVLACAGAVSVADSIRILQSHHKTEGFNPRFATASCVCMHPTGFWNPSSSTGSMVAVLRQNQPSTIWLTGTSMPCLSIYIPFFFPSDFLGTITRPGDQLDDSLWWKAEKLHRWVCKDYQKRKALIEAERQAIQQELYDAEAHLMAGNPTPAMMEELSKVSLAKVNQWLDMSLALL